MATIKQGILGAFSGKIGNVVGSSWKGIPVMKSLPPSVANPKTTKQIAQRARLSALVQISGGMLAEVIKPLNDRFQTRKSGYNAFVQANMACFTGSVFSNPANLQISPKVNKAQLIDAIAAEANITTKVVSVIVGAQTLVTDGKALDTDVCYLVAVNSTTLKSYPVQVDERERSAFDSERSGTFTDPDTANGVVYHFYQAFLRNDGTVPFATAYKAATATI